MRSIYFILAVATCASASGAVSARAEEGCKPSPKEQWKSPEQAKKAAIEQGFTKAQKVILEDGCYEVVTINNDGKIVGVHFDPVTLKLVKVEAPR